MNPLPWMTLVFLLSARCSLANVDQNWLRLIVRGIRQQYGTEGQFSLAANIPVNLKPDKLHTVLPNDDGTKREIVNTLNREDVYRGNNVVIAKPKKEYVGSISLGMLHAEYRVLANIGKLTPKADGNLLLIYSYISPCDEKCTDLRNTFNIINIIKKDVIPKWHNNVAFVFKKVFDKPKSGGVPGLTALRDSLKRLGDSGIGLQNIFRCDDIGGSSQCFSCSTQGSVSEVCVDNNFVPGQGASSSSRGGSNTDPQQQGKRSHSISSRDETSTGPKKQRDRSSSSSSRSPRRNRSSTKRSSRSRMRKLDEFWFLI